MYPWHTVHVLLSCCFKSSFFAQTSQTHRSCNFKSGIYLVISITLTQPSILKPSLSDVVLSSSSSMRRCLFECFLFTLIEHCFKCDLCSGRVPRCTEQAAHDSDASVQSESRNQVRGFHSQSGRTQWRPQDRDPTRYPPTRQRRPPRQRHVTAPAQVGPAAKHPSQMISYLQLKFLFVFLQLLLNQHLRSFNFRSVQQSCTEAYCSTTDFRKPAQHIHNGMYTIFNANQILRRFSITCLFVRPPS